MTDTTAAPIDRDIRREALHASVSDPLLDTMNFLNEVTFRYPDAISFAPGRPYDGFFDVEQVFTALRRYLDHLADTGWASDRIRDAVFQYGPTAGRIREEIAGALWRDEGIDVAPEAVVVTVGAQEAMVLTLRTLFATRDDVLLVPSPCYVGIAGAARILDIAVSPVDEGPDGLRVADVAAAVDAERARGRRPRAMYLVPDHSNPMGSTMDRATREELLDLAERRDLLILEDSPYRLVSPGARVPTLKALDRRRRVLHIGSFAKTLFPGARIGYAIADQVVTGSDGRAGLLADDLSRIKSMITVNTPSLSQAVVAGMLLDAGGGAAAASTDYAALYGDNMAAVLGELDRHFPAGRRGALGIEWNRPTGGFFLTVRVPFRADEAALERSARDHGVIWTPMSYFYPGGGGHHSLRLSVSYLNGDDITDGIARLARFVTAETGGASASPRAVPDGA